MTERELEARKADIIEAIQKIPADQRTVRGNPHGHALYAKARRAFGSWRAALEAAGVPDHGYGDPGAIFKNVDAISPNPLPGLPAYMRQRQILGGKLIENLAARIGAQYGPTALEILTPKALAAELEESFYEELRDWHAEYGVRREPVMSATAALADLAGDGMIAMHSEDTDVSGDIDLPNRAPVDHGRR